MPSKLKASNASQNAKYLPSGEEGSPLFKSDDFRMWCMKVIPCTKRFVHDWTVCPFAHIGEKAARRDPRQHGYTGIACPDMKKVGACIRANHCPYAHNVFEYWLHPTRYRTQLCNDGPGCRRAICFFAHSLGQLRVPAARPYVSPEALARASLDAMALHPYPLAQAAHPLLAREAFSHEALASMELPALKTSRLACTPRSSALGSFQAAVESSPQAQSSAAADPAEGGVRPSALAAAAALSSRAAAGSALGGPGAYAYGPSPAANLASTVGFGAMAYPPGAYEACQPGPATPAVTSPLTASESTTYRQLDALCPPGPQQARSLPQQLSPQHLPAPPGTAWPGPALRGTPPQLPAVLTRPPSPAMVGGHLLGAGTPLGRDVAPGGMLSPWDDPAASSGASSARHGGEGPLALWSTLGAAAEAAQGWGSGPSPRGGIPPPASPARAYSGAESPGSAFARADSLGVLQARVDSLGMLQTRADSLGMILSRADSLGMLQNRADSTSMLAPHWVAPPMPAAVSRGASPKTGPVLPGTPEASGLSPRSAARLAECLAAGGPAPGPPPPDAGASLASALASLKLRKSQSSWEARARGRPTSHGEAISALHTALRDVARGREEDAGMIGRGRRAEGGEAAEGG